MLGSCTRGKPPSSTWALHPETSRLGTGCHKESAAPLSRMHAGTKCVFSAFFQSYSKQLSPIVKGCVTRSHARFLCMLSPGRPLTALSNAALSLFSSPVEPPGSIMQERRAWLQPVVPSSAAYRRRGPHPKFEGMAGGRPETRGESPSPLSAPERRRWKSPDSFLICASHMTLLSYKNPSWV